MTKKKHIKMKKGRWKMNRLTGVITALMTVADSEGKIDIDATLAYARHCVDGGVNGLFVLGTNGEGINYSIDDRVRLAEALIKQFHDKVKICIHTGASRLEDTIELTKKAYELGADCAAIVTPAFVACEEEELYQYYHAVSECAPKNFPLYMYNIPPRTGNDLKPNIAQRIFCDCENIVGMKASFCDLQRTMEYLSVEGMALLQGTDVYQLEFLTMGCDGIISGLSGVYPVPFVKVREAWKKNDIEAARIWQKICYEVSKVLSYGNVTVMQAAMEIMGYKSTDSKCNGFTNKVQLIEELKQLDNKIVLLFNEGGITC